MSGHDLAEVVGAIGIFTLLITVVTVTVWQLFANSRAKVISGREEEWRRLADESTRAQETTARRLAELTESLAETRARVDAIERVLKEVE